MFKKSNKKDFNTFNNNCKVLKSLYDVEFFLRKLSCAKNSICIFKKTKYLMDKTKKF